MKKMLYLAAIMLLFAACGGSETTQDEQILPKDNAVEPYEPEAYQNDANGGEIGDSEESASDEDPFK